MITHDNGSFSQDNETNTVELPATQTTHSEPEHNNMEIFVKQKEILLSKLTKRMLIYNEKILSNSLH